MPSPRLQNALCFVPTEETQNPPCTRGADIRQPYTSTIRKRPTEPLIIAKMRKKFPLLASLVFFANLLSASAQTPRDSLDSGFQTPPESAKPRTWWHWVSGNVSAEGITADLEAMKRIGLGGAQIFTVEQSNVKGPVHFMTPEWRKLVHLALGEAERLHLELGMQDCEGWSESGGTWITPAESMQKLVWTQTQVQGGQNVAIRLPAYPSVQNFYEDIAVLAFPSVAGDHLPDPIKISASAASFGGAKVSDNNLDTEATLTYTAAGDPQWIQLEFADQVTARSASLTASGGKYNFRCELQVSNDGASYQKICDIVPPRDVQRHTPLTTIQTFKPATGKFFRLWIPNVPAGTPPLQVAELKLGGPRMENLDAREGFDRIVPNDAFSAETLSPQEVVAAKSLVDLSGKSNWNAPAGNWTIVRLGHTSTGITNHPAVNPGLECDKMNVAAVTKQFQNMFGPVFADSPRSVGSTLKYVLLDSWEAGCENWTPLMRDEFRRRRGYDLAPWLPVLAGYVVDSGEASQRFLWDYRRTLADLVAENHYGTLQKLAHDRGMGVMAEAVGIGMPTVADELQCKGYTDIPMGEFWVHNNREGNTDDPKEAASAAHIYGRNIAATESYTSGPETAAWKNDPASLKAMGDHQFCLGINRFVFHRYAHQPWLDRKPGMSMGPFGINFERTNTWWEEGSAWMTYLSRCEYLLQQGRFQADLCYFYGEGAPNHLEHSALKPAVPKGYDYDVCDTGTLLKMQAANGRLVLPGGMSYRVLVLPEGDRMTLPVLQKIKELVGAGAVVYGPKPRKSPSLVDYPTADAKVATLAQEIWGPENGPSAVERNYGRGKIVWNEPIEKVLGVPADFSSDKGDLVYIHRQDGPVDLYFVSNQETVGLEANCTFRVAGKIPELWHPDTGVRETLASYVTQNGLTTVPIRLDSIGSVFVVFRNAAPAAPPVAGIKLNGERFPAADALSISEPTLANGAIKLTTPVAGTYELTTGNGRTEKIELSALPAPLELTGAWQLSFPPKLGAPANASFERLISWPDSSEEGVKYFSGTATYSKDLNLPVEFIASDRHLYLDLGTVKNLAEVSLNGQSLGILWKPPFVVDIARAAKRGANHLEIKVTNLWPNRLIGDQKLPENQRVTWASVSLYKADSPLQPSGLIGPVTIRTAQDLIFKAVP